MCFVVLSGRGSCSGNIRGFNSGFSFMGCGEEGRLMRDLPNETGTMGVVGVG